MGYTWLREEASIFLGWSWSVAISAHQKATRGLISTSDGDQTAATNRGSWSRLDCGRSPRDRDQFTSQLGPRSPLTDGPQSSCDCGHQNHLPTRSNGLKFERKSPFKPRCIYSCSSQLLTESWRNEAILKQDLQFFMIPPRLDSIAIQSKRDWSSLSIGFHRIFPLMPNVREEEIKKIRFNTRELKPHLCGNHVSSEIRSIIWW